MAKRGFFMSALEAMIAAREKQAQRYVTNALLMMDDESLKARGYSRIGLLKHGINSKS